MGKKILAKDVERICRGTILQGNSELEIKNLNIDTRTIRNGQIFVAIGDGNKYISTAFKNGAIGVIAERVEDELLSTYPQKLFIKVADSIKTMQELAKEKRAMYNIPVIAITGSVGKTSTKDIVAKVVEQKFNVLKTEGNFNNHIGLPLTILKLDNHEALVVEMGMNHFGEIATLTNIAKPTIAVITNIGTSHIGILGSRENILKAKIEILEGLESGGKLIINNDNDLLHEWNKSERQAITYGIENSSDIMAENIKIFENESTYILKNEKQEVTVPISGTHFIYNSLCAIAVGKELGISIKEIIKGISKLELTQKRMEKKVINGVTVINDAYNASYESMKYSLEYLKNSNAIRKIAILGDMLELGEFSKELHEKVGKEVVADILITVGKEAKNIAKTAQNVKEIYTYDTNKEASEKIKAIMKDGDIILLKASNGMRFTEILSEMEG